MMIKKTITLILLLTIALLPVIGQQGRFSFPPNRSFVNIPVEISQNLVVIPVSINDSPPLNFILDTGIRTTILTEPAIAQILELDLDERIYLYGLGGSGLIQAAKADDVTLKVGSITGNNMNLIVLPEGLLAFSEIFGFPVYGIIGYDLFRQFPVSINYISRQIRIYKEPTYRMGRRTQVVPLQMVDGKPYTRVAIIGHQGDTLTTNLLVDLGASHPLYINDDHVDLAPRTLEGFLGKGISGTLMGKVGRISKIMIGEQVVEEPIIAFPHGQFLTYDGQQLDWEGLIGGGLLSRFHLLIDYPSGRMVLDPNNKIQDPFIFNLSGLEVIATGPAYQTFKIQHVRPGSAAYEAGIMAGDLIISLNSRGYKELSLQQILEILSGEDSDIINIEVVRGTEVIRRRFRLRSDI